MQQKKFDVKNAGGYVHVYLGGGDRICLDLNFFDGDRSLSEAIALRATLDNAIEYAKSCVAPTDTASVLTRHGAKL
jgi:hypothetical protein